MLGPGRPHDPPRRPRRRRHQGRAAAGRLRPADDVADRRRRLAAVPPRQPGQTQHRARPAHGDAERTPSGSSFGKPTPWSRACARAASTGAASGFEQLTRSEPADRVRDDLRLRHDRPVPRHAEPRHRVRRVGGPRAARHERRRFPVHAGASVGRHPRRAAVRCARLARRRAARARDRRRLPSRDRAVGCRGRDGLAAQRDVEGVRAAAVGGDRERGRQLRTPRAGNRGHGGRRSLPVLRVEGRPRVVHGVRARVLAELLRRRRPPRPVRTLARIAVRRPRARQRRAARDPPRHLRDAHVGRVARRSDSSTTRRSRRRTHRRRCSTIRSSRTGSRCIPAAQVGADMLPTPIKFIDEELPIPTKAPTVGEHTEDVLRTTCSDGTTPGSRRHAGRRLGGRAWADARIRFAGPGQSTGEVDGAKRSEKEKRRWERRGRAAIPGVPLPVLQGVRARRAGGGAPDPDGTVPLDRGGATCRRARNRAITL